MTRHCSAWMLALLLALSVAPANATTRALIVTGLGGETTYDEKFAAEAAGVASALATLPSVDITRLAGVEASRENLAVYFDSLKATSRLMVFLVGHGSYDEVDYKFNLPGPDVTDKDLANWLDNVGVSEQLIVLTGSASGAVIDTLAADERIVVTATRSGVERHATHFGRYFAAGLTATAADTNKNRRISVQEAFEFAADAVSRHFSDARQLATEHAVLTGQRAERWHLARTGGERVVAVVSDPELARLQAARDAISADIETLTSAGQRAGDESFRDEFTRLMIDLALAEEAIEAYQNERTDAD